MALALSYQDKVLYACSCSQLATLGELFFCRHCKVPRCQDCVSSTIESFSCPHCFEAAMTDALKSKKGRCSRCFQCPQCFSTLTTRSVIVPSEVLGEQSPQKDDKLRGIPSRSLSSSLKSPGGTKLYFLACSYCKWSTRDVGIKDKRSPIDFKDRSSPHQQRLDLLIAFYKDYAMNDIALREKKKSTTGRRSQRSYGSLLDPTKFLKAVAGSESPLTRRGNSQWTWNASMVDKMAADASNPQPPSNHFYTQEVNLEEVSTMEQQLKDPVFQPEHSKDLAPCQLSLTGKKLHRCKGCEHILMKAELNLNSIRFKIQQLALHSFPQVRIAELLSSPSTTEGEEKMEVVLSVSNPLNYGVTVTFSQCLPDEIKSVKEIMGAVSVPEGEFFLSPNDDVVELLEGEGDLEIKDDPQFVHLRLPGKLFLRFQVTPEVVTGGRKGGRVVKFMFRMSFSHKSTIEADEENETCMICAPVLVRVFKY